MATIKQITRMTSADLNKLSAAELRKGIQTMRSAIDKRISRLEKAGFDNRSLQVYRDKGRLSSGRDVSFYELRSEYARGMRFLKSPQTTVTGERMIRNKVMSVLKKHRVSFKPTDYDDFWKAYERLKDINGVVSKQEKYERFREIASIMQSDRDISLEDLVNEMLSKVDEIYERTQSDGTGGVSQFFEEIE